MPEMSHIVRRFAAWWRASVTKRDRILGTFVGALGCFWIGSLGRVALVRHAGLDFERFPIPDRGVPASLILPTICGVVSRRSCVTSAV
jgi:hypothetical protein